MSKVAVPRTIVGEIALEYYRTGFAAAFPLPAAGAFDDLLLAIDRADERRDALAGMPLPSTQGRPE